MITGTTNQMMTGVLPYLPYITEVIGFIITIVSIVWAISRKYSKIESKFINITNTMKIINNSIKGSLHFQEIITATLSNANLITKDDYLKLITNYKDTHLDDIDSAIDALIEHNNPLTTEEIERLKIYKGKINNNQLQTFTEADALDFEKLLHKEEKEHPDNAGIFVLLGLAALILGLIYLSKK